MNLKLAARENGFTLVELCIVVALIAILGSLSYPSMSSAMAERRLDEGSTDVMNILQFARFQAVLRGRAQIVGVQLATDASPGGTLTVREGTSTGCSDIAPEIVNQLELAEDVGLTWMAPLSAMRQGLCFRPDGRAYDASATLPPHLDQEEKRAFGLTRSSFFAFRLERFQQTDLGWRTVGVRKEILVPYLGVARLNQDLSNQP